MAKELWDELKSPIEFSSISQRMFLRRKLNTCRMDEGESISSYLDRIKEIQSQLNDVGDTISNEELVAIALNGFSNEYKMFVSSIAD
jgi:hypothetical protein